MHFPLALDMIKNRQQNHFICTPSFHFCKVHTYQDSNLRTVGRPNWLARLSRVAPTRSRVRILGGTNFCLVGKKIPSLCSPKGLALSGMGQSSGVFPRPGEAVLLPLNKKRWGPFTPRRVFFFVVHAMLLLHFHITSTYMLGVRLASAILSNSG